MKAYHVTGLNNAAGEPSDALGLVVAPNERIARVLLFEAVKAEDHSLTPYTQFTEIDLALPNAQLIFHVHEIPKDR